MRVVHRTVRSALWVSSLFALFGAASSPAQVTEAERRAVGFTLDPIARSPRLLGMGRLTLADDVNNKIDLWDFAANPTGIVDADSASTLEFRPATSSGSGVRLLPGRERQYLAGRDLRLGFEGWRRVGSQTAYGIYGDASTLRTDRPFGETVELRSRFQSPSVAAALSGRMPFFLSERLRYGLQAHYSSETTTQQYRTLFTNGEGEYLGHGGDLVPPPNFFDPDEYRITTLGGNAGLAYRFGSWLTASVVAGGSSSRIEGENSSLIHTAGTGEDRPYYVGQASVVGKLPVGLEYGADGRAWTSESEDRWVFTLKAGLNQDPFTGRGKKLDREETGQDGRARLRWTFGNLQLNAGGGFGTREIEISAPLAPDSSDYDFGDPADRERYIEDLGEYQSSYNYFINVAANRIGADSLALPDSVAAEQLEERFWNAAYGAVWRLPGGRGALGVEYHLAVATQERGDRNVGGVVVPDEGPRQRTWDVRSGLEYACSRTLLGRVGYIYRSDDRNEFTRRNEFKSHTFSLGLGLRPPGSIWGLDVGWALEWIRPEEQQETVEARESRQQLAAQLRWRF